MSDQTNLFDGAIDDSKNYKADPLNIVSLTLADVESLSKHISPLYFPNLQQMSMYAAKALAKYTTFNIDDINLYNYEKYNTNPDFMIRFGNKFEPDELILSIFDSCYSSFYFENEEYQKLYNNRSDSIRSKRLIRRLRELAYYHTANINVKNKTSNNSLIKQLVNSVNSGKYFNISYWSSNNSWIEGLLDIDNTNLLSVLAFIFQEHYHASSRFADLTHYRVDYGVDFSKDYIEIVDVENMDQ